MNRAIIFSFLIFISFAGVGQQTGYFTTTFSWTNNEGLQNRSLRVLVPASYDPANEYPLVIGFHGLGGTPVGYCQSISYYANNPFFGRAIVACPSEGTQNTSWFSGGEDFKIISAVITKIRETYNIDTAKVFATGFSFGGKSAYLHGLDEADYIKGIIAHSPGFYNTADINNTCTEPLHCQHKYNYQNAWKIKACITAGSGEYNLGLTEPYLTLASKAVTKLNKSGCDAIFIEDPNGAHNLPPVGIVQQCWTHVNKPSTDIAEVENTVVINSFQNPASGKIEVALCCPGTLKIATLYTMAGAAVVEMLSVEQKITLNISKIPDGVYLLRVIDSNSRAIYSQKVVVANN